MTEDHDSPRYFCGSCGVIFGLDDIDDFDDVHCPDCDSGDVAGVDED